MTLKNLIKFWTLLLNEQETKEVDVTYFFNFVDQMDENCALLIKDKNCTFIKGKPDTYSTKINVTTHDWIAILSMELSIESALSQDKLSINGKDLALKNFFRYFSGSLKRPTNVVNYVLTENEKELLEGRWHKPQKVLGLIGSPRKNQGVTTKLYSILIEGLSESGCTIDTFHLIDLENKPCKGCFACWFGDKKCVHSDEVNDLILKIPSYDLVIFAVPVYVDGLPGAFKNFIDRTICLIDPEFVLKDDHSRHPSRNPSMPHLVLVSTCGYAEIDNFSPMIEHVKEISKNLHLTYLGEILVPNGWLMTVPHLKPLYESTIQAIKQAGKELVDNGRISQTLIDKLSKPIFTREQIFSIHNSSLTSS
jgi:multimeric flavodoxin WrbA